jgi:hypothetical protein
MTTNERWEYKTLVHSGSFMTGKVDTTELETALNKAGSEGWEVASTATQSHSTSLVIILKRKL